MLGFFISQPNAIPVLRICFEMFQLIFYKVFPAEKPFLFSHDGTPSLLQTSGFPSRKSFIKFLIEHFKTDSYWYISWDLHQVQYSKALRGGHRYSLRNSGCEARSRIPLRLQYQMLLQYLCGPFSISDSDISLTIR